MAAKQKIRPAIKSTDSTAARPASGATAGPLDWRQSLGLQLLVFVAGAVLMGVEIVGSRLLAPYFGNSVFVWGSLISLFLIALSTGYYLGGLLSDRHPSQALLNIILMVVSGLLLAIAATADPVCNWVQQQNYGEKGGPFVASVLLFLLPSIGMGMASPFAVRLATSAVASVGKTAGTLYALSTMGSIVGTLVTTFVLIPLFGATAILKGLAFALLLTALATFPFFSVARGVATAGVVLLFAAAAAWGIQPTHAALPLGSTLVADIDTPYHHIWVVDEDSTRQLRFDKYVESAIELAPPHRSLSPYTTYFHLAMLPQPNIRRALFIGAGGGVGPRAFHMHNPEMEIDVVDIDSEVLRVAYEYFFLDKTPKIKSIAADGRMFVRGAKKGSYDCIILDAFTIGGRIPFHLVTKEFFELCREKMAPGGVFLMNINSAVQGDAAEIFRSMYKTIDAVYPNSTYAFAIGRNQFRPEDTTNIILVATMSDKPLRQEDWRRLASEYSSDSYVPRRMVERMIDDLVVTLPEVSEAPLFTDDYAPIETMGFESN